MFSKKFKLMCVKNGVSPAKVAESLGMTRTASSGWTNGKVPKPATLQKIADYFGVDVEYFLEEDEPQQVSPVLPSVMMPIIGTVKAGYGGVAEEEYTGEYRMVTDLNGYAPSECRLLQVSGDSMYPLLMEGDTVLVHCQPEVDDGDIAVILQEDEATIKKFKRGKESVDLIPINPEYKPRSIKGVELRSVRIYGKVLSLVHRSL